MIVLEKTKDIAILRSMGYERRDITQIFGHLLEHLAPDTTVTVLQRLSLPDEVVREVPLAELDRRRVCIRARDDLACLDDGAAIDQHVERLWNQSRWMAGQLRDQFGVKEGDRVGIWLKNCPEFVPAVAVAVVELRVGELVVLHELARVVGQAGEVHFNRRKGDRRAVAQNADVKLAAVDEFLDERGAIEGLLDHADPLHHAAGPDV